MKELNAESMSFAFLSFKHEDFNRSLPEIGNVWVSTKEKLIGHEILYLKPDCIIQKKKKKLFLFRGLKIVFSNM